MRKLFTLVLMAALAAVPSMMQAQVKFGVKAGLNVTQMSLSQDVVSKSNQEGFFVGPTVKVTLPLVGLGVDASALYDQRDAKVGEDKVSQRSINVPINLRYGVGLGSLASVYLAAGPQFGFNIGQKNYSGVEDFKFKESNFSVNVGAGVSLINHVEVGFTYNIAVGKTGEISWIDDTKINARANSWQVSAAYYF